MNPIKTPGLPDGGELSKVTLTGPLSEAAMLRTVEGLRMRTRVVQDGDPPRFRARWRWFSARRRRFSDSERCGTHRGTINSFAA